jgi:hypothetical protein
MKTNSTTAKRAMTAGPAVVWQPSALYRGAAERRVKCLSSLTSGLGGGLIKGHAFRPEGLARQDRRRNQS